MLDQAVILEKLKQFVSGADANRLMGDTDKRIFDEPLIGYASAEDELFFRLKEKTAIGPHHCVPTQWLDSAKTVISVFLPFSEEVRRSNRAGSAPSPQWLFGRIEGQQFVAETAGYVASLLKDAGHDAVIPSQDPRFTVVRQPDGELSGVWRGLSFTSNWSERHAAYICGLGTFGLSKGLITKKGMAGRFCSIVTDAAFSPTEREYTGLYDYCILCGACAKRCPVHAITLADGKDHFPCGALIASSKIRYAPRYGCGKCQTCVPCESGLPRP